MKVVNPLPQRVQEFLQGSDDSPIVMINLLRYRARAEYPPDAQASACSGREAYVRYSSVALKKVMEVGGKLLWRGTVQTLLIAPEEEMWDDAVVVQYPSRKAFVEMVSMPDYRAAAVHRTAALEDSRLIATVTVEGALPA